MSLDELLQHYDQDNFTRSEFLARLAAKLSPDDAASLRAWLSARPELLDEFEQWVDDLAQGDELFPTTGSVTPEDAIRIRAGAARWQRLRAPSQSVVARPISRPMKDLDLFTLVTTGRARTFSSSRRRAGRAARQGPP